MRLRWDFVRRFWSELCRFAPLFGGGTSHSKTRTPRNARAASASHCRRELASDRFVSFLFSCCVCSPFCDKVKTALSALAKEATLIARSPSEVRPSVPTPAVGIEMLSADVGVDDRLAAQCSRASGGSRTVPQVFLNTKHVGGHDDTMDLIATGMLLPLLVQLAKEPHADFPSMSEAAMVCVSVILVILVILVVPSSRDVVNFSRQATAALKVTLLFA